MYNIITMKKTILCITMAMMLLFACTNFGCTQTTNVHVFNYFNTAIRLESHSKPLTNSVINQLDALFRELDATFDANNQNSQLYKFNAGEKGCVLTNHTIANLTKKCKDYYALSHGKFNPAIRPLVSLWQFDTYKVLNFTPPTDEKVLQSLVQSNFDFVSVNLANGTITKSQAYTQLDFGGVLKGYAVDKALEILQSQGYDKGYLSMGGSSIALLNVTSLAIRHPRQTSSLNTIVNVNVSNLKNTIVSTSGDYEKYYDYQGVRYSHIIDSTTGKPADTGIMSATLIGLDGGLSDALSTAICAMDYNPEQPATCELVLFLNTLTALYPDCAYYVFYGQGDNLSLITNKKQGEDFTLLDNQYKVVNL